MAWEKPRELLATAQHLSRSQLSHQTPFLLCGNLESTNLSQLLVLRRLLSSLSETMFISSSPTPKNLQRNAVRCPAQAPVLQPFLHNAGLVGVWDNLRPWNRLLRSL